MAPLVPRSVSAVYLREILKASGLWMDKVANNFKDRWGLILVQPDDYKGFVTYLKGDPLQPLDPLLSTSSTVSLHDGIMCDYVSGWIDCDAEGAIKRGFEVRGASFALVERVNIQYRTCIPERIFLFPHSPKFEPSAIVWKLEQYRRAYPPRIYLCSVTNPNKKKENK